MANNIQVQSSEVVVPLLAGIATFSPLATVAITDTTFNVTFTGNKVAVGDKIVITGTLGGTGTIVGYATPTTYRVKSVVNTNANVDSWPLVTGAQLENTDGTAVVTTAGSPTGLTYGTNGSPQTINNARIVRLHNTVAATTLITITNALGQTTGSFTMLDKSTELVVKKSDEKVYAAGTVNAAKVAFGD